MEHFNIVHSISDFSAWLQEEDFNVAEALNILSPEDTDPRQGMLFQLPSLLPSPAKEVKTEPLDRRRKLGLDPPPEHQPALTLQTLQPGKVHPWTHPSVKIQTELLGILSCASLHHAVQQRAWATDL